MLDPIGVPCLNLCYQSLTSYMQESLDRLSSVEVPVLSHRADYDIPLQQWPGSLSSPVYQQTDILPLVNDMDVKHMFKKLIFLDENSTLSIMLITNLPRLRLVVFTLIFDHKFKRGHLLSRGSHFTKFGNYKANGVIQYWTNNATKSIGTFTMWCEIQKGQSTLSLCTLWPVW